MESRHYETVFILSPVLSKEQARDAIEKYKTFLVDRNAVIEHEQSMGLRPLAYPIKHKKQGEYYVIEFVSDPGLVKDLEVAYSRDDRVLRFLTISLGKDALEYKRAKKSEEIDEEQN